MAPGTVVGHMHLHVRDLDEATTFYAESLGMLPGVSAPAIGFADLSASQQALLRRLMERMLRI